MSNYGYEIVEPEIVEDWLAITKNREFLVALLSWIVVCLQKDLERKFPGIEIAVVKVEYCGAYPAIGVRHEHAQSLEIATQVNLAATDLLQRSSVLDFVNFLFSSDIRWADVDENLFLK